MKQKKVYFTKNPVAINDPQWIAFAKYSYSQLKWSIINKPNARDAYINDVINSELNELFTEIDRSFDENIWTTI